MTVVTKLSQEQSAMETSTMQKPLVTIVVVPRERFSYSRESLESIYSETDDYPFELVYVDGGSSPSLKRYLQEQAKQKNFKLIRTEHFISPNKARNLGLKEVKTKYLVFIDNDVLVKRGWLQSLVETAEETNATVVGTLTCIDEPVHEVVHNGGGETYFETRVENGKNGRFAVQNSYLEGRRVSKIACELERVKCDFVELHCALVRTEFLEKHGGMDEGLLSTREHIDMCLMATHNGGTVYCDRQSIVTYMTGAKLDWWDVTYFMLRWSDAWDLASFNHFRQKWGLQEDWYFEKRYNRLGRRRYRALLRPVISRFPLKDQRNWFADFIKDVERPLNNFISDIYARKHEYARHSLGLRKPNKVFEKPEKSKVLVASSANG